MSNLAAMEDFYLNNNNLNTPLPPFLSTQPSYAFNILDNDFCCPIYQWMIDSGVGDCNNCSTVCIFLFFFIFNFILIFKNNQHDSHSFPT